MQSEENYNRQFNQFISSKIGNRTNIDEFTQSVKQFYKGNTGLDITDNFFLHLLPFKMSDFYILYSLYFLILFFLI